MGFAAESCGIAKILQKVVKMIGRALVFAWSYHLELEVCQNKDNRANSELLGRFGSYCRHVPYRMTAMATAGSSAAGLHHPPDRRTGHIRFTEAGTSTRLIARPTHASYPPLWSRRLAIRSHPPVSHVIRTMIGLSSTRETDILRWGHQVIVTHPLQRDVSNTTPA